MAKKNDVIKSETEVTIGTPQTSAPVDEPNRAKLRAIYEAYKKQSPDKYVLFEEEYAKNLEKSEEEIGRIIS